MTELFDVIAEYADDIQVYISTPAADHSDATNRLTTCITRIRDWMVVVSNQLLQRLQVIQNAAARLVTGARRSEHYDAHLTQSSLAAGSTADNVQDTNNPGIFDPLTPAG